MTRVRLLVVVVGVVVHQLTVRGGFSKRYRSFLFLPFGDIDLTASGEPGFVRPSRA